MSATVTWMVERMDCYPQAEGQTDVVFTVFWRAKAKDGEYFGSAYGSQGVVYAEGSPFTPYANLTQDQVVGWVQSAMGPEAVDQINAGVLKQIEDQKNPPTISPELPWAS